jgi:hypothetical protein
MPRGGGMRSGKPKGSSWGRPNPRPLIPRGRKVGKAGLPAWCRGVRSAFGQSERRSRPRPTRRSRNRRAVGNDLRAKPGPRRNRHRRERRAIDEADLQRSQELVGTGIENAGRQVPFGVHEPVRVGSTARSAPFLFSGPFFFQGPSPFSDGATRHFATLPRARACRTAESNTVSGTTDESFGGRGEPLRFVVKGS